MGGERTEVLVDRRFVAAVALLVLNDRVLKGALGAGPFGLATGKLSDVAAMVIGPVLVAAIAPVLTRRHPSLALVPPGLLLTAINLSAPLARAYASGLETITRLDHHIVVDPSDLVGLLGLPIAARILAAPQPLPIRRQQLAAIAIGVLAVGAATASSEDDGPNRNRIVVDDERVVASSPYAYAVRVSDDDGVTWTDAGGPGGVGSADDESGATEPTTELCLAADPSVCVRLADHLTIEESTDGGLTWARVWRIEGGSDQWLMNDVHGYQGTGIVELSDLAETDAGSVLAAASAVDPLRRGPDGRWKPSIGDLRRFQVWTLLPMAIAVLIAAIGLAAIGSEPPHQRQSSLSIGLGLAFAVPGVWFVSVIGGIEQLWLPVVATVAVIAAVIWWRRGDGRAGGVVGGIGVALVIAAGALVGLALWLLEVAGFLLIPATPLAIVALILAVIVAFRGPVARRLLAGNLVAGLAITAIATLPLAAWSRGWSTWNQVHLMASLIALIGVGVLAAAIRAGTFGPATAEASDRSS